MSNLARGATEGTIYHPEQPLFMSLEGSGQFLTAPEYLAGGGEEPAPGQLLRLLVTEKPKNDYRPWLKRDPLGSAAIEGVFVIEEVVDVNQDLITEDEHPFSGIPENIVNGGTHYGLVIKEAPDAEVSGLSRFEKAELIS